MINTRELLSKDELLTLIKQNALLCSILSTLRNKEVDMRFFVYPYAGTLKSGCMPATLLRIEVTHESNLEAFVRKVVYEKAPTYSEEINNVDLGFDLDFEFTPTLLSRNNAIEITEEVCNGSLSEGTSPATGLDSLFAN